MRIRIDHETSYGYDRAARFIVQILRLTPRSTANQHVHDWRIDLDVDARLRQGEDAYGNVIHTLYTDAPTERLTIRVSGEVDTSDTGGVLPAAPEKLSPLVYRRETLLTHATPKVTAFAGMAAMPDTLGSLHRLNHLVHQEIAFEVGATTATHTAAEVLGLRRGVCQDHAHLFIACARKLGVPARYISGHLLRSDGETHQDAAHAWAEAFVEDLGWVGFDPANGVSPTEAYVRVAAGLDYLGAAPVRGAAYGGGSEHLSVRLTVRQIHASQQSQQQA